MRKMLLGVTLAASALLAGHAYADPYVGEIRTFAGNGCPQNWLAANGAQVPIMRYQALMSVLGTKYGGNGVTTLGLPNIIVKTSPPQPVQALTVCIATTGSELSGLPPAKPR